MCIDYNSEHIVMPPAIFLRPPRRIQKNVCASMLVGKGIPVGIHATV